MDSWIKKIRIKEGTKVSLADHPAGFTAHYKKEDSLAVLDALKERMHNLQEKLYAGNQHSVLVIFQAMDAAGKDSVIGHVMSGLNPQGCQVYSFKQPSAEEAEHDFLWRHSRALPARGDINIHNRSHYENVLIARVHPELVLNARLPGVKKPKDVNPEFWKSRYESIVNFEKHLVRNGTVVLKFFLNVSKEEQKERFLDRIADPLKNWKFSAADVAEREHWDAYMHAYEQALSETSLDEAPWFVIPADKKWFTRIAVAECLVQALESLDLQAPQLSETAKNDLEVSKKELLKE